MSIIAAALKHMLASGMTHDAIVAAVEEMEASATASEQSRTARQERNRRYYESKRLNSDDSDAFKTVKTLSDGFKTPKTEAKSAALPCKDTTPSPPKGGTSPKNRGHRFENTGITMIPPEWQAYANSKNLPEAITAREFEKFGNYWRAKSGGSASKQDWLATWRNWVLTAAEGIPQTKAPAAVGPSTWAADKWRKALGLATSSGKWEPDWGPPPDDPQTLCPPDLRHLWTRKAA